MEEVKYRFAKDENGNLVDANEFDPSERSSRKCYCISCGEVLIPVLGKIRKRHFRHEADKPCNGESYLHELGKRMLMNRWETSSSFFVKFKQEQDRECSYISCPLKDKHCIKTKNCSSEDLKKYYHSCSIEKSYNGFIADLLLEDTTGKYPPIMLEVCVSHPCSEDKKSSGMRIIEFEIESEEQAKDLLTKEISENDKVRFYNFVRKRNHILVDDISWQDEYGEKIVKAVLYESGKIYISQIDCKNIYSKPEIALAVAYIHPSGGWLPIDYAYIPHDEDWHRIRRSHHLKKAKEFFAQKGFNVKSCDYCSNLKESSYGDKFCWCYKKRGTPRNPNPNQAYFCPLYSPLFHEKIVGHLWECDMIEKNPSLRGSFPNSPKEDPSPPPSFPPLSTPASVPISSSSANSPQKTVIELLVERVKSDLSFTNGTYGGYPCFSFYMFDRTVFVVKKAQGIFDILFQLPWKPSVYVPDQYIAKDCPQNLILSAIEKFAKENGYSIVDKTTD